MGLLLSATLLLPGSLPAASKANQDSGQVPVQGSTPNPGYRLAPNDVIKVQVFGEEALTTETRVSGDGKIALPLLGVLEIKGLTVKETEELITSRLADGFLKHPRVSIYITRYRNFFVSGEVRAPGGYTFEEGLTVLKAVTLAGGFTDKASTGRIKIKRLKGKEEETIRANLEDPVLPDDIIVVPQSFF
jgi:polysaccharide biosynthesis/export protein VpsN